MKKILSVILCLALILSLCACGKKTPPPTTPVPDDVEAPVLPVPEDSPEPVPGISEEPAVSEEPVAPSGVSVTLYKGDDNAENVIPVECEIAEIIPSPEKETEKLLKGCEKSLTLLKRSGASAPSMKWWEETNEHYRFLTNLDKAKGGRFIKDTMKQLDALRRSYEFYIPPGKDVEVGVVRVFRSLAEYREYRA